MKISQKRTCEGCRALYQGQYIDKCELGYMFNEKFKPLEQCPKPKTLNELLECIEWYKKQIIQ